MGYDTALTDDPIEIAKDVAAIGRIQAVPTLLRVLCDTTGMGFAAVARVTDGTWTACAVQDDIAFGLAAGGALDVHTTLCKEVRASRRPVVIDHASADPTYRTHPTPRHYAIESYVSVPIVLSDGEYFGNLCAIDPRPAPVSEPRIAKMFARFAELIAVQLEAERRADRTHAALLDAQAEGESRDQLIAIVGHDLRGPLSAIVACSQLLERKAADPDIAKLARRITTNSKRMSGLIDDVFDFARGRLGEDLPLGLADVDDLGAALAAVVEEVTDAHPELQIESHIAIDGAVRCDRGRLQQLVANLLANAVHHGAPGGLVRFDAERFGDVLRLEVGNGGEPIPAEHLGKVFDPFWRRYAAGPRQGLGLGLHICRQIVLAHAGSIEVRSTAESGTHFVVRLPAAPPPAPTSAPTSAQAPAQAPAPASDVSP